MCQITVGHSQMTYRNSLGLEKLYNYRKRMLRLFFIPQWKTASEKLQKVALWHTNSKLITYYKDIAMLVITDIISRKKIKSYITAMTHATLNPELLLKYSILIHLFMQEQPNNACDQGLVDFLGYLLKASNQMVQHYAKIEEKEEGSSTSNTKSACTRSASTRSEELVICKEIFLISTIVRPYIAFLLKLAHSAQWVQKLRQQKFVQRHEAWSIINLLKMVVSVTCNFTMIGRYYIRAYGCLVVLLTKTISSCVRTFIDILSKYVYEEVKQYEGELIPDSQFAEFIKILEEINKLNDQLLPLYLSKYFFDYVQDIPEPKWINTSAPEFDCIFRLNKNSQARSNERPRSQERRDRRSLKKGGRGDNCGLA